ncbi:hypothetical protein FP68_13630, partial [Klebsiella pneumoniae]
FGVGYLFIDYLNLCCTDITCCGISRYIKLIKRLSFFDNVSNLNILIDDKPLLRRENVYGVRESDNLAFDINALCKFTEYKGADKSAEK